MKKINPYKLASDLGRVYKHIKKAAFYGIISALCALITLKVILIAYALFA